jgi:hypothetical protein
MFILVGQVIYVIAILAHHLLICGVAPFSGVQVKPVLVDHNMREQNDCA